MLPSDPSHIFKVPVLPKRHSDTHKEVKRIQEIATMEEAKLAQEEEQLLPRIVRARNTRAKLNNIQWPKDTPGRIAAQPAIDKKQRSLDASRYHSEKSYSQEASRAQPQ